GQAQDRRGRLVLAEHEREVRAFVRAEAHHAPPVGRHDEMERRPERSEIGQRGWIETFDRGDRTPGAGALGHAEDAPLPQLEDSAFSFVRHSARRYRWAIVRARTRGWVGVPYDGRPRPVQGPAGAWRPRDSGR